MLEEEKKRRQSMNVISDEYQKLKEKNEQLTRELEELKKTLQENTFKTPPPVQKLKKKAAIKDGIGSPETVMTFLDTDDEDLFEDDSENDPDWRKTPLFKRLQKSRRTTVLMDNSSHISIKRSSDGGTTCTCKQGSCRRCACRKNGNSCGVNC